MPTDSFTYIGVGVYSVSEASKLSHVSAGRIRRWLRGYEFKSATGKRFSKPVVTSSLPLIDGELALNFLDLQEIRYVDAFLDGGVKWRVLREVHAKAQEGFGLYPFSRGQFATDGFLIFQDLTRRTGGAMLDVFNSQTVFKNVVAPFVKTLKFAPDGQATEWWPLGKERSVVVTPSRGFGQPIVADEGVPTNILARAYRAERSYPRVARWYDVSERAVRDAVEYETTLAAA